MKTWTVLLTCLAIILTARAEPNPDDRYRHQLELGEAIRYKSDTVEISPYLDDPILFHGIYTERTIHIKPGESFARLRDSRYHEYQFDGPSGNHLAFTHRIYIYTLGEEIQRRRYAIKGKLVATETFTIPQDDFWCLIDYSIYVEGPTRPNTWKSK